MDASCIRTCALIGERGMQKLRDAAVLVAGLGGVGGYVVEGLARAGVGRIGLLDCDRVEESNLNRQILATRLTLGMAKTEAARERVLSVAPSCRVDTYLLRYGADTADEVPLSEYDWVADAVDDVAAKVELICRAKAANVKIVSSMGTGNKLSADFVITDIKKTSVCPLARAVRKALAARGVTGVDALWSSELPKKNAGGPPSSVSYVPAVAGMQIAGHIIRSLIAEEE